jgi:hypothetical protein
LHDALKCSKVDFKRHVTVALYLCKLRVTVALVQRHRPLLLPLHPARSASTSQPSRTCVRQLQWDRSRASPSAPASPTTLRRWQRKRLGALHRPVRFPNLGSLVRSSWLHASMHAQRKGLHSSTHAHGRNARGCSGSADAGGEAERSVVPTAAPRAPLSTSKVPWAR